MIDRIRGYAEQVGRTPTEIGVEARLTIAGQPRDNWLGYVAGWQQLGATHLCVNTMGMQFATRRRASGALADAIACVRTITSAMS